MKQKGSFLDGSEKGLISAGNATRLGKQLKESMYNQK